MSAHSIHHLSAPIVLHLSAPSIHHLSAPSIHHLNLTSSSGGPRVFTGLIDPDLLDEEAEEVACVACRGVLVDPASSLHPAPCTLHPAPCTLHPAPCTLTPRL